MRHAVRARIDLAERQRRDGARRAGILESDAIRASTEREIEQLSKVHVGRQFIDSLGGGLQYVVV